jgi:Predicted nucleotide-binding protein containing TIR-like domain
MLLMPKRLNRLIEIRIEDSSGKRLEGTTVTIFGNGKEIASIPATGGKDPSIQVDRDAVVKLHMRYFRYTDCVILGQDQKEWVFTVPDEHIPKKVFIGSSSEGENEARIIQKGLARRLATIVWPQNFFELSEATLETLVDKAHSFTHAILVLTPDDMVIKRADEVPAARDNVLFELGLFMGALGRKRTFIVAESSVRLPSDLWGITTARFERGRGIGIEDNMGPVVTTLMQRMGLIK